MEWPSVYGHIATATGWTLHEIDQLTLWEANELFTYWQDYPPVHVLVSAYLLSGSRKSGRQITKAAGHSLEAIRDAVQLAGGGFKGLLPSIYRSRAK